MLVKDLIEKLQSIPEKYIVTIGLSVYGGWITDKADDIITDDEEKTIEIIHR